MSNAIKCIVRQGWTTRDADGNLIERRDYVYVTNEDGTPHIYASIAEARADIRGNYGRDANRAGILHTHSVDDYTGHVHEGYVYIVREDADEFAAATADAKAEAAAADKAEQAAEKAAAAATTPAAAAAADIASEDAASARAYADRATETAKQCARELEERAEIIAQIEDPQHREYIRATAEAHQWTPDETRANVAYYAANRAANAAARALLAEYAETTGRTIEQDDDEYIAAHRVARDEVTGVSARATGYDREIVADMVERIAQAVRDDMPTGPENYRPTYQRFELLAYLGEPDDYDVTAIEHDATAYDPATGRTVWAVDAETLAAIAERHQLQFYAPAF